ncbi:MAG: hypothetical protein IMW92_10850 [Bacillales bacterium]|nr:hypothetical protein [Bacillales bacterium]
MPRGKELEQLPMSNIAPGAGEDPGRFQRRDIKSGPKREGKNEKKINRK